jgi:hypothetical protein
MAEIRRERKEAGEREKEERKRGEKEREEKVGEIKRESHLFTWKPGIGKDGDWGRDDGGERGVDWRR